MSDIKWNITLKIYRQKENEPSHYQDFFIEVDPDEYVLDAIERVWAFQDRTLVFRHACHHSTCGACGMRVDGVEKLTCITSIRSVTKDGATLKVEPLRNFPVVSDLAVNMGSLYARMETVKARSILPITEAEIETPKSEWNNTDDQYIRLSDCIECGLCISACPSAATSPTYLGPAVLAGAQANGNPIDPSLVKLLDSEDGLWRCHSAFECTAVCPSNVDPGRRIMNLRTQVISDNFHKLFHKTQGKTDE